MNRLATWVSVSACAALLSWVAAADAGAAAMFVRAVPRTSDIGAHSVQHASSGSGATPRARAAHPAFALTGALGALKAKEPPAMAKGSYEELPRYLGEPPEALAHYDLLAYIDEAPRPARPSPVVAPPPNQVASLGDAVHTWNGRDKNGNPLIL
jgi:hypothetical protein